MSRWHYYIESKSRMKITTEKGSKKDIEIKNVVTIRENKHMLTISNKPTRKVVMESIIALLVYFIFLIIGILHNDPTGALIASCVSFTTAITMGPMLTHFMNFANIKIIVWLVSAAVGGLLSVSITIYNPGKINPLFSIENIGNILTIMSIGFVLIPDMIQDINANL